MAIVELFVFGMIYVCSPFLMMFLVLSTVSTLVFGFVDLSIAVGRPDEVNDD